MDENITQKDEVKSWYFENPNATLKDASVFFDVPYNTIRMWSSSEGWQTDRIIGESSDNITSDVELQARDIRRVLYEEITENRHDAKDLSELVKAWKSLIMVSSKDEDSGEFIDRDELSEMLNEAD